MYSEIEKQGMDAPANPNSITYLSRNIFEEINNIERVLESLTETLSPVIRDIEPSMDRIEGTNVALARDPNEPSELARSMLTIKTRLRTISDQITVLRMRVDL